MTKKILIGITLLLLLVVLACNNKEEATNVEEVITEEVE